MVDFHSERDKRKNNYNNYTPDFDMFVKNWLRKRNFNKSEQSYLTTLPEIISFVIWFLRKIYR